MRASGSRLRVWTTSSRMKRVLSVPGGPRTSRMSSEPTADSMARCLGYWGATSLAPGI
jgi:hypothetical protein